MNDIIEQYKTGRINHTEALYQLTSHVPLLEALRMLAKVQLSIL